MASKASISFDSMAIHRLEASKVNIDTACQHTLTSESRIASSVKLCADDTHTVELKARSPRMYDTCHGRCADGCGEMVAGERGEIKEGGNEGKSVLGYVMRLKRLFVEPWRWENCYSNLTFVDVLSEVFASIRSIVYVAADSVIFTLETSIDSQDQFNPNENQSEILLVPKLNKESSSSRDNSFEDEASVDYNNYKNSRFIIHILFDYQLTQSYLTVGRLVVFQIDNEEGNSFYEDMRYLTDINTSEKDSETAVKTYDYIKCMDRWQFDDKYKVVMYSFDLDDCHRDAAKISKATPALVYSDREVRLNGIVMDGGKECVEVRHFVVSSFLILDRQLKLNDCYFHYAVDTSESQLSRYLVYHRSTTEHRISNGIEMFKGDEDSWKLVGDMEDSHQQWYSKSESIKLYMLKADKKTIGGSILSRSNLFKTTSSSTLETRNYGFTEVLWIKEASRLIGHLYLSQIDTKKPNMIHNDGVLFQIKDFVLTGTVSTVNEALNLAFPAMGLLDSITQNPESLASDFSNNINWNRQELSGSEDNDFEAVDPSLHDSLSVDQLKRSVNRSSIIAFTFTVRLFSGIDFQKIDLSVADEVFLEGMAMARANNCTASISYANMTMTKQTVSQGFMSLPRIVENKRQANYIEIEMARHRIDSLVLDCQIHKKIKARSLVVKEYGKAGCVLRILLKVENLSVFIKKKDTESEMFNFRQDTDSPDIGSELKTDTPDSPKMTNHLCLGVLMDERVDINSSAQTEKLLTELIEDSNARDDESIDLGMTLGIKLFQIVFGYDPSTKIDTSTYLTLKTCYLSIDYSREDKEGHKVSQKVTVPHFNLEKLSIDQRLLKVYESNILPMVEKANPHLNIENYIKRLPVFLAAYQGARAVINQTKQSTSLRDANELKKIAGVMAEGGKQISNELWNGFKRLIQKK